MEMYPGTSGSTHGERNDRMPAPNAARKPTGSAVTAAMVIGDAGQQRVVALPDEASGKLAPYEGEVGVDHLGDEGGEVHLALPPKDRLGL